MGKSKSAYLAIDMGAESARAIAGHLENGVIHSEEIHRWPSRNVSVQGVQYWDVLYMFGEVRTAIKKFVQLYGDNLSGIGVDSWGVDYGLLGESGQLLQNPVQYRDHRTDGLLEKCGEVMPPADIYRETGIAFLPFNTLLQLWSLKDAAPELIREGRTFLMMPDLLHYFLCGVKVCEYTNASTTQLLNVATRTWSEDLFEAFNLPINMMPKVVEPGTILGQLAQNICEETGLKSCDVIAPCTHDTASAVLAVPADGDNWAYISCGTWSLLGAELDEPITTEVARAANFTNEGGHGNTIRFLKNIVGLWVLQQARAAWQKEGQEYSYAELTELAEQEKPFRYYLDVSDARFYNPPDMLEEIRNYYQDHDQQTPESIPAMVRAILEGIAVSYAHGLTELESVTGKHFEKIHMVGGGIQNKLLCQMASSAMGRTVLAGPVEGTALGNIATQALAKGDIANRENLRKIVLASVSITTYEPQNHDDWIAFIAERATT